MIVTYMNWVVKWWLYINDSSNSQVSVLPLSWVIKTEPPACAKYTSWLTLNNSDFRSQANRTNFKSSMKFKEKNVWYSLIEKLIQTQLIQ